MSKIYAYVSNESCAFLRVRKPGEEVDGRSVNQHGDYNAWRHGKRETLRLIREGTNSYTRRAAMLVAWYLGWL
jgi:hypothetical protein